MNNKSIEIKQGIKAHIINTDLFKTNLICIIFTTPLTRENVTKNALIPFLLRRGSKKFNSQIIINKELENMYGATFDCGIDKIGDNQVLKYYIDVIDNRYSLDGENLLKKALDMILDITFNPLMDKGVFKESFFNIEKENLRKVIESKIDNKDLYALNNCISSIYGENGFGLYKFGYKEDIDNISLEKISNHYNSLVQNAKIDIFISGNFKENEVEDILYNNENLKKIKPRKESYIINNEFTEIKQIVDNPREIKEKMNVTQGKLVIGLDVLDKMDNLQSVGLVYNAILGDGATSMLFQNVREKASLAYTAKSNFIKQKLNIFIKCGIQIDNYEKTLKLIKKQLDNIREGKFSEEEIKNAKSYLISGIKNVEEEQDTEIVYYIGQEISKTNISIKEYINKIENVTKDEIIEFSKKLQINTIYFLRD